ncbi:MAG: isoleucine--tRNA ligase [Elusimicrobia bacterium]|nr:isoleucine--tRNA ligase [Elusimicrobiota bacterium]
MTTKNIDYSKTVFLPKTGFSMKGDLPRKEPQTLDFWAKERIFERMLDLRKSSQPFILHDGPPYANGHIHMGHVLNKILKDILVKSYSMSGYYTPYIPGWDCHGLPIEQQLLKELKLGKRHIVDIPSFRKKAREFAGKFINIQKSEFKRLGVFGAWENPYLTMSNEYEGTVIKAFREMLEKGYVYRDKKTIYWCINCETALADAEVEYKDKTSHSIYVKFKLTVDGVSKLGGIPGASYFLIIWTTTPWTLPANMAAAVSKDEEYVCMENADGNERYIAADKLADNFMAESGLHLKKGEKLSGASLVGLEYEPCLKNSLPETKRFPRKVVCTDFVDMSTGTGIVHMAPGHGEEDFHAGKKWGIEIFCPVNEEGKFTQEAGVFSGLKVFEANEKIIEVLNSQGSLAGSGTVLHSYPHCWRCKQPVIFRATEQWFLGVDVNSLRERLILEADKVKWVPGPGKERMRSMLALRPDWCLSRQRYWGTPIMILYCKKCRKPQVSSGLMKSFEQRVFAEGSDFWFIEDASALAGPGHRCDCGSDEFYKEKDILDVWLDSGVSWYAVLKNGKFGVDYYPCDVYLEGSDQHRGWFQTSLIPSVVLNGTAPYKIVLTHGFLLDDKGRAMHKSFGNAVSPDEIIKKYGAEVLRLWVTLSNYSDDVRISEKLLSVAIDAYRKIRNTMRYLLGNLADYSPGENQVEHGSLLETDRYMRHKLALLIEEVGKAYLDFEYRHAIRKLADFCILDLSAFYLDSLKDRLYTFGIDSIERRSGQTVLYDILTSLLSLTAPVLSFTAEEAWQTAKKEISPELPESVFLAGFPESKSGWLDEKLAGRWLKIMEIREKILKAIEEQRQKGVVGSSLEAKVVFKTSSAEIKKFLEDACQLWTQVAIVSDAEIRSDASFSGDIEIEIERAEGAKCPRCWQWKKDVGADASNSEVCLRCAAVLKNQLE